MEAVGQSKWAEKAHNWLLERDFGTELASSSTYSPFMDLLTSLPVEERADAIKKLKARKEVGWDRTETSVPPPEEMERRCEVALATLGIDTEFKTGLTTIRHRVAVVSALHKAGQIESARSLLHDLVRELSTEEPISERFSPTSSVQPALTQCFKLGELELAEDLIRKYADVPQTNNGYPRYDCLRHAGFASGLYMSWAEAFEWSQQLPRLDDRLGACAGILKAAANKLTLRPSLRFGKVHHFPNYRVIMNVGLYPSILGGFSFGC